MRERQILSLSDAGLGCRGTIVALTGGLGFQRRIASMGLEIGRVIEVIRGGDGRAGPVLVTAGQTRLAIGYGMARRILVQIQPRYSGKSKEPTRPSSHVSDSPSFGAPKKGITVEKTLFDLVTGDRARIVKIRGSGPQSIRQRLLDMGVTRGTDIYVERHAPLGDPVEITIKGYYLALRMSEAREIEVEEI